MKRSENKKNKQIHITKYEENWKPDFLKERENDGKGDKNYNLEKYETIEREKPRNWKRKWKCKKNERLQVKRKWEEKGKEKRMLRRKIWSEPRRVKETRKGREKKNRNFMNGKSGKKTQDQGTKKGATQEKEMCVYKRTENGRKNKGMMEKNAKRTRGRTGKIIVILVKEK